MPASAQLTGSRSGADAERLVITGTKTPTDQEVTRRVEAALDANPYLDASRVTVSTKDGVVTLEGIVGDASDLLRTLRIAGRVAGARRVEESLYIPDFDNGP
jgi:osmotically-inducible protein OsmY